MIAITLALGAGLGSPAKVGATPERHRSLGSRLSSWLGATRSTRSSTAPPAPPGRRGISLARDLQHLAEHPTGRDPTRPGYLRLARWAAAQLAAQGIKPAGTGWFGRDRFLQPFSWQVRKDERHRARSANVVGLLPGDGSTNEAVVVMAHLDGLSAATKRWYETSAPWDVRVPSMKGYRGANDNASSVAGVLYIADALARLRRQTGRPLKRDVIFLLTSAEEEGGRGAEAFARFARQFRGKRLVGAINLEMIGRGDPQAFDLLGGRHSGDAAGNPLFQRALALPVRGSTARVRNATVERGKIFRRSDHYLMSLSGVHALLYMGQMDADYHTPRDTVERVQPRTQRAVARHALRVLADWANRKGPLDGRDLPLTVPKLLESDVKPASGGPSLWLHH